MLLPTGGSIVYDYESNTYSKYNKGSDNIWHIDLSSQAYYDKQYGIPLIPENFILSDYGPGQHPILFTNSNSSYTFTISDAEKTLFFKAIGQEYESPNPPHPTPENPNPEPILLFPTFKLTRISPSVYEIPHFDENGYYVDNTSGLCLGQKITLSPGTYTVSINSINEQFNFGSLDIKIQEENPNPRKWYYGGGIRIKQIGFFNCDAPSNYYDDGYLVDYVNQGYMPVSEKKYNYNFFGTNNSSGYLANTDFSIINYNDQDLALPKMYFGGYKNVTVTDSQNNGREEYVFKDCLDPFNTEVENSNVFFEDGKRGLLISKKTFDSNNTIINSVELNYDFIEPTTIGGFNSSDYPFVTGYPNTTSNLLEIAKLTKKTTTEYYPGAQSKSVVEYFNYDTTYHNLKEHSSTNSMGEVLRTEYSYDTNNSPFSTNRIYEPLETKRYRGNELISTSKINYSNIWPNNQSFLTNTLESSRSTNALEVNKRFNLYDEYSNLLEEQQENGMITSYIWGYNKTYIIAKLENISYANIPSPIISYIQGKTNSNDTSESEILTALSTLYNNSDANLKKAMITSYTYKPLIGLSSIRDAKGDLITYEYDSLGRLIKVRDKDNNILSETQYNLSNQN